MSDVDEQVEVDPSAFRPRPGRSIAKVILAVAALAAATWGVWALLDRIDAKQAAEVFSGEAQAGIDRMEACLRGERSEGTLEEAIVWRRVLDDTWDARECHVLGPSIKTRSAEARYRAARVLEAAGRGGDLFRISSAMWLCGKLADLRAQANTLSEVLGLEPRPAIRCGIDFPEISRWAISREVWGRDFAGPLGLRELKNPKPRLRPRRNGRGLTVGIEVPLSVLDDLSTVRGILPLERAGRRTPTLRARGWTLDGATWTAVPVEVQGAGPGVHERVGWAFDEAKARWIYAWRDGAWAKVASLEPKTSFVVGATTSAGVVSYVFCGEEDDVLALCRRLDAGPAEVIGHVPEREALHHLAEDGSLTYLIRSGTQIDAHRFGMDGAETRAGLPGDGVARACADGSRQWVVVGRSVHSTTDEGRTWRAMGTLSRPPQEVGCLDGVLGAAAVHDEGLWLGRCADEGCRDVEALISKTVPRHATFWGVTPSGPAALVNSPNAVGNLLLVTWDGTKTSTALFRTGPTASPPPIPIWGLDGYRHDETWYLPITVPGAY
jgi:hypothetical protein